MSDPARRGAAVLREYLRRGVLGTDPEVLLDLLDLCRHAEGDEMVKIDAEAVRKDVAEFRGLKSASREQMRGGKWMPSYETDARASEVGEGLAAHCEALLKRVAELEAAAAKVVSWRHKDGTFVDGFRAQECLNELAALGLPMWPPGYYPYEPAKSGKVTEG